MSVDFIEKPMHVEASASSCASTGVVVIGRNEGQRLKRCLEQAAGHAARTVYVDSGSTDGSVARARSMHVDVVELTNDRPFSAARARNEGALRLLQLAPDIQYVQFVDGDCEIMPGWWNAAPAQLEARPDVAVVCGRRRERYPRASIYNRMCDLEWNTAIGETSECGGDALMRVACFQAVGGFDASLIAGEEPELCLRLRAKGWKIERLDVDMTLHDAAMQHFSQWWRREKRTGYAFAEAAHRFGSPPEHFRVALARRNWFWGLVLPVAALAPAYWTGGSSLILLLAYPLLWARVFRYCRTGRAFTAADAAVYAMFCTIGKFPQVAGQLKYVFAQMRRRPASIIEYKSPG